MIATIMNVNQGALGRASNVLVPPIRFTTTRVGIPLHFYNRATISPAYELLQPPNIRISCTVRLQLTVVCQTHLELARASACPPLARAPLG